MYVVYASCVCMYVCCVCMLCVYVCDDNLVGNVSITRFIEIIASFNLLVKLHFVFMHFVVE